MGNLPGNHGRGGFGVGQGHGHGHGMFGGQQITQYGGPAYHPPPYHPGQGPYPPPQGFHPGYPQGPYQGGYGHGYHPQGPPPGGYYQQRPGTPVAALGQAASCGSCIACLTCVLCSCSPCIMGAGARGMSDEAGEDGNQIPDTAHVSTPHDDDAH